MKRIPWKPGRNLVIGLGLSIALTACGKSEPPPPPPIEVQVAQVLQRDVPIMIEEIGQTLGSSEVEVRARVEGFLDTVDYKEGSFVRKGDLLYTIDPQPLEAKLARTRGELASSQADLARASQDVARYRPLVALNAIPRQQFEQAVAIENASRAAVDAMLATVRSAELDLGYTRVTSPIDGLAGKTEVKSGNLVGRGETTLLTTISTIDPIHVRFSISETDYLKYARSKGTRSEAEEEGHFELVLGDGSAHLHRGNLVFSDRLVDATTGTLLLEAAFPNPERLVRPGQYARVRAAVDRKKGAILVPQRAVRELQATYTVAVVSTDGKVSIRTVKPGERIGSLWLIESGLAAGESVVVEGLQKVKDGATVKATVVNVDDAALDGAAPAAPAAKAPAASAPGKE
jgi:membrane fusion protein (multidrug efflux system)